MDVESELRTVLTAVQLHFWEPEVYSKLDAKTIAATDKSPGIKQMAVDGELRSKTGARIGVAPSMAGSKTALDITFDGIPSAVCRSLLTGIGANFGNKYVVASPSGSWQYEVGKTTGFPERAAICGDASTTKLTWTVLFTLKAPVVLSQMPGPAFDPAKPDEIGPVWTHNDAPQPFIVMALPAGHSETRTFTVRNPGPGPTGPMRFWIDSEGGTGQSRIVKIDPASPCVTIGAPVNETCTVNVTVTAPADGQFMVHVRFLQGVHNEPPGRVTLRTILEIHGYGTGFGTKLPDGVVGNGSRCPAANSRAEVALSNVYRGSGYPYPDPDGPGFTLTTAECESLVPSPGRGSQVGRGCERPIKKQYRAPSITGPWTLVSRQEKAFRGLALLCENDILTLVIPR
jgi:hypothetical protein